jgi:hypothetical protein
MTKNYHELIKDRIYIGGAADAEEAAKNEQIDFVFDLRDESPNSDTEYTRIHSPIVDDAGDQDDTIKESIHQVVSAYREGKKVFFIAREAATELVPWRWGHCLNLVKPIHWLRLKPWLNNHGQRSM